jgi:aldehyde dehydrogenase (NAD+)
VAPVSVAQAADAVETAREAFEQGAWSRTTAEERSRLLHRLADLIERDADFLSDLMIDEIGTPRAMAEAVQLPSPIYRLRWNADAALKLGEPGSLWPTPSAPPGTRSVLELAPVGVVFGMAAYNYLLSLAALKMGPALAAGCSIVLMSSPKAVLSTAALFRLVDEAGFPPGAVNFIFGTPDVAQALCQHNGVDLVSFTGSAAVGRQIAQLAAPTLKRLVLELGGKSADILLPGVNLEQVVAQAVMGWTGNAGQGCGCLTRTLVHRSDYSEFVDRASALVRQIGCGDPKDPATLVGPLVSREQRDNVAGYVTRAVAAGANVVVGGQAPAAFPAGFFYEPTIVTGVDNSA